ncbi:MAG: M50 family metallopeptidase [Bacteroidales bacterium]|jgi:hypothetical protein|nr:M50 family metallopeptidase [Bacteroidales bacterium]NPV37260.1 M50 family metallopeptidase [Bacteroidales bacterium]
MDKDILVFYGMLAFAIILTRIPYVGKFFRVTGTLFHEAGHVWVALLLGHRVKSVSLFEDLSGEAITAGSKGWGRFFIAFGGYPFASVSAWFVFYLLHHGEFNIVLIAFAILILLFLIFYVRNGFGIFWCLTLLTLTALILYYFDPEVRFAYALLLAMLLLADSFISPLVLLIIAFKTPARAGDAYNLKKMTGLPEFFWAFIFVITSAWLTFRVIASFFPFLNHWLS